jgi:hypothetical protein
LPELNRKEVDVITIPDKENTVVGLDNFVI